MSQALYRKWRPHLWEQVIGQDHVIQTIRNAIRSKRVGHAYLFAGPRGTGKTTTARLLAKAVNCQAGDDVERPCDSCDFCLSVNENRFLDLIEIDAASNTSVDDVRDLRDKINFAPTQGEYKVYIIDEVHMLSTAAFNALLKTLEEPPAHAIFILATTEVHKIPATVLSRCQRHEFRRISVMELVRLLTIITEREGISIEDEALTLIARQSTGSARDAISLLDQLASTGEEITLDMAQTILGTATSENVINLVDALRTKQAAEGLNAIHSALDCGSDPRQFARQVVEYLRSLLLIHMGNANQVDATEEIRAQMALQASELEQPRLLEAIRLFNAAASDRKAGWHPGLLLELALAEAVEEKPISNPMATLPQTAVPAAKAIYAPPPPVLNQQANTTSPPPPASQTVVGSDNKPGINADVRIDTASEEDTSTLKPNNPQGEASLDAISRNWNLIQTEVKKHAPNTAGLLNSCKQRKMKDGILILYFASELLKSKMEDGKKLELTSHIVSQILGVEVPIKCAVTTTNTTVDPSEIENSGDGMVSEALNLGGQIKQNK
jgi:DNA polymerase III subunit gamma/tau